LTAPAQIINNNALIQQEKYRKHGRIPARKARLGHPFAAMRMSTGRQTAGRACLVALLLVPFASRGAAPGTPLNDWGLCHVYSPLSPPSASGEDGVTLLSADEAEMTGRNLVTLHGGAEALRGEQSLRADTAIYNKDTADVHAEGNVQYTRPGLVAEGDRGQMNLDAEKGRLDNARFRLYQRHARGSADSAAFLDRNVTVLRNALYTTCDPGNDDWLLRAGRVRLDQASGTGTATNVSLSFMGVPFLYSPWLSFPIDDRRKSGFLAPVVGESSRNGVEIALPYYLNLHPQFDATLTPRLVSRRGLMLGSELRYLNAWGEGSLDFEYLPDDKLVDEDRSLLRYRHDGHPVPGLTANVDYSLASDADYFRDLGNSLSIASVTHLDQHAAVLYQADTWMASGRLQSYQTIDDAIPRNSRPYEQLPILVFRTQRPELNLRPYYRLVSSYVDFQHSDRIGGQRLDLQPGLSLPLYTPAAYFQPTATLRYTHYGLDARPAAGGREQERTLPVFSIDSGLFLERDTDWGGLDLVQTLEPRLYYLNVPYRDQSDIPLFDTGLPDFNLSQLFRDNRFNGSDRVGDANQLSVAVSTRFLERETGRQRAQFGIGRIYYFEDRRVTLGGLPETAPVSDLVAEANASLSQSLTATVDARKSEATGKIDKAGVQLTYKPAPRSVIDVSYRFREGSLEQTDIALVWPLSPRWRLIARRNYSIFDHQELETLAGVEYQTCCWRLRLVNRRYLNTDLTEHNRIFYVQLDLLGLTTLGERLENLLDRGILDD
jgi:LPS-assembly protein